MSHPLHSEASCHTLMGYTKVASPRLSRSFDGVILNLPFVTLSYLAVLFITPYGLCDVQLASSRAWKEAG